jgi:hypothetical protein
MSKKHNVGTAWVAEYGEFGYNSQLVTFDSEALTEQQWDRLAELADYDRIEYVLAILDGDDLTEWENEDD